MEHRYSWRQRIFAVVEMNNTEIPRLTGMVYNFSFDGAFILCNAPPNIGKFVNIRLITTLESDLLTPVSGIIIHRNEHGFGVMFCGEEFNIPNSLDRFRNRCLITTYI